MDNFQKQKKDLSKTASQRLKKFYLSQRCTAVFEHAQNFSSIKDKSKKSLPPTRIWMKNSDILLKKDKSKKKGIDKEIKPLIDFINSLDNYYTTSSCSGRIVLLVKKSDKKQDNSWLFCSHSKVNFNQIKNRLKKLPKYPIWFKQESAILHICCKTIEDAQYLVDIARYAGFKRTGIQSTRKKVNVEIGSSDVIDAIIAEKGGLLITEDYFKVLIREANKKLEKNKGKIKRFYKEIKK